MRTAVVGFVVAAWVAAALTPLVRALARRVGAVDKPDDYRKTDRRAVPLLGGIAVFAAFPVPIVALALFHRNNVAVLLEQHWPEVAALLAGGAIALGLGIVDDVMQLPARWKLLFQVAAAAVAVAGGFCVTAVSNPFGGSIFLGWLGVPVTILWFIGCMNALNLLDGLDGLAAGVGLFVAVTLLLVSSVYGNGLAMLLLACLAGAIAGFLRYNFHPASIFLGDSGSMLLGFWVAALSLLAARKAEAAVALLVPFIALGLPIFDTTLAILRRWSRKLPISAADRQHIHHKLLAMGLTHRRTVLVLYVACAMLGAAALLISAGRGAMTLIVVGSLALLAYVCIRAMGTLRLNDLVGRLSRDWATGRRSAQARVAVEKARHLIRSAPDVGRRLERLPRRLLRDGPRSRGAASPERGAEQRAALPLVAHRRPERGPRFARAGRLARQALPPQRHPHARRARDGEVPARRARAARGAGAGRGPAGPDGGAPSATGSRAAGRRRRAGDSGVNA